MHEVYKGVSDHLFLNVCSDTRVTAEPVSTSMDIEWLLIIASISNGFVAAG